MKDENKSNLKKTLMSQTWNENLTGAIVNAIEEELMKPKPKAGKSMLKLAIEKEKREKRNLRSFHGIDDNTVES